MCRFDRIRYNRLLGTKVLELEKIQKKELDQLVGIKNSEYYLNPSNFLIARVELKEKHYKEKLNIIIESLLGSVSKDSPINVSIKKICLELLQSKEYIEHEKNDLRSILRAHGLTPSNAIFDEQIISFESHLSQILFNAREILELAIDDHNNNTKSSKETNGHTVWGER